MRLIDADALKSWIDCGHLRPPTELCFSELDVVQILDERPTIDAVPVVHAGWEREEVWFDNSYALLTMYVNKCSACGFRTEKYDIKWPGSNSPYNFCPYCGARMDGDS